MTAFARFSRFAVPRHPREHNDPEQSTGRKTGRTKHLESLSCLFALQQFGY
jgi:hypothetical protein